MIIIPLLIIFIPRILEIQCGFIDSPTLKPIVPFSAEEDAEAIRKEITSTFINRNKIAHIIFHRPYDQRRQIEEYYNKTFCSKPKTKKCPLQSALKDISTDNLDKLYNIILTPPEGLLARVIYDSICSGDGEVGAIEQVVCANDKAMKDLINKFYQANYQTTVEDHLTGFRSDDQGYQNVMLKYCWVWKGLCQDSKISPEDADKAAQALKDLNHKDDKEGFKKKLIELLDTTCEPDLKLIFEKYRHDKKGISHGVDNAFKDERERRAYNILVRYIVNTCAYYAGELHSSIATFSTLMIHFHKINRIVVTRCERDLLCIEKAYHDKHHKTFTNKLKDEFDARFIIYGIDTEDRYLKCIRYLSGKP